MNERIDQLLVKAGAYFGAEGVDYASFEPKKFAELIVWECIRVPYDMWDKSELNADIAIKIEHRIKDHFGVEE